MGVDTTSNFSKVDRVTDLEQAIFELLRMKGYKVCRSCWVYFGGVSADRVSSVSCRICSPPDFAEEIRSLVVGLGPFRWGGTNQTQYEIDVVGNHQGMWYLVEVKERTEPVSCEDICYHFARAKHFAQRASMWFPVYVSLSGYENKTCNCDGRIVVLKRWHEVAPNVYMYKLQ